MAVRGDSHIGSICHGGRRPLAEQKFGPSARPRDWWSPPLKLGSPKAFDLITDPKEEYPETAIRSTWNAGPAMAIVAEFEQSLRKYPAIAPGTPDPYTPSKP